MMAFSTGCRPGLGAAAEMLRLKGVCSSRHEALTLCFPLSHTAPQPLKKNIVLAVLGLHGCIEAFSSCMSRGLLFVESSHWWRLLLWRQALGCASLCSFSWWTR